MSRISISTLDLISKINPDVDFKITEKNGIKIYYLWDYHPLSRKVNGHKEENDKFDNVSELLLRLKEGDNVAIEFIYEILKSRIEQMIKKNVFLLGNRCAVIPSSNCKNKRTPMHYIIEKLCSTLVFNILPFLKVMLRFDLNALVRFSSIQKLAYGGSRDINVHLNSIFCESRDISYSDVILFDDIVTTGNSMSACYKILKANNAINITCISLAKTSSDSIYTGVYYE